MSFQPFAPAVSGAINPEAIGLAQNKVGEHAGQREVTPDHGPGSRLVEIEMFDAQDPAQSQEGSSARVSRWRRR